MSYAKSVNISLNFIVIPTINSQVTDIGDNMYSVTGLSLVPGKNDNGASFSPSQITENILFISSTGKRWLVKSYNETTETLVIEDALDDVGAPLLDIIYIISAYQLNPISILSNISNNKSISTLINGNNLLLNTLRKSVDEISAFIKNSYISAYHTNDYQVCSVSRPINNGRDFGSVIRDGTIIKGYNVVDVKPHSSNNIMLKGVLLPSRVTNEFYEMTSVQLLQNGAVNDIAIAITRFESGTDYIVPSNKFNYTIELGDVVNDIKAATFFNSYPIQYMWICALKEGVYCKYYIIKIIKSDTGTLPYTVQALNTAEVIDDVARVEIITIGRVFNEFVMGLLIKNGNFVNLEVRSYNIIFDALLLSDTHTIENVLRYQPGSNIVPTHFQIEFAGSINKNDSFLHNRVLVFVSGSTPLLVGVEYIRSPKVFGYTVLKNLNNLRTELRYRGVLSLADTNSATLIDSGNILNKITHAVHVKTSDILGPIEPTNRLIPITTIYFYKGLLNTPGMDVTIAVLNMGASDTPMLLEYFYQRVEQNDPGAQGGYSLRREIIDDFLDEDRKFFLTSSKITDVKLFPITTTDNIFVNTKHGNVYSFESRLFYRVYDPDPNNYINALYSKTVSIPYRNVNIPRYNTTFTDQWRGDNDNRVLSVLVNLTTTPGNFSMVVLNMDDYTALDNLAIARTNYFQDQTDGKFFVLAPDLVGGFGTMKGYTETVTYSDSNIIVTVGDPSIGDLIVTSRILPISYLQERISTLNYFEEPTMVYGIVLSNSSDTTIYSGDVARLVRGGELRILGYNLGDVLYGHVNGVISTDSNHVQKYSIEDYPIMIGNIGVNNIMIVNLSQYIFKYYANVYFVYQDRYNYRSFSNHISLICTREDNKINLSSTNDIVFSYGMSEPIPNNNGLSYIPIPILTDVLQSIIRPLQYIDDAAEAVHAAVNNESDVKNNNRTGSLYMNNDILRISTSFLPKVPRSANTDIGSTDLYKTCTVITLPEQYLKATMIIDHKGQIYIFHQDGFKRYLRSMSYAPTVAKFSITFMSMR